MKRILLVFTLFSIAFYSCKTDKTKTTETTKENRIVKKTDMEVKAETDILLKNLDQAWNEMMVSDDQKLDNLQTLLARVGRDKNFDQKALSEVLAARDNLKTQRYNRETMADISEVDAYDSVQIKVLDMTNELLEAADLLARDTIAAQLSNKIQEEDSRGIFYRAHYDQAARNFNQFLVDYKAQLQQLGPPYSQLKPVPLFAGPGTE